MLFCGLAILSSTALYGCAGNKTTTTRPEHIYQVMQPASLQGQSTADYPKIIQAGDEVSGNVNITGEWEVPTNPLTHGPMGPGTRLVG